MTQIMRPEIDGKVALVTGASSGIGEAIARALAPRLSGIALVARRADRLEALASDLLEVNPDLNVCVQPCDLTDRAATGVMLLAVKKQLGDVELLVNNAGFGNMGMYDWASWPRIESMIALNVTSLSYLTHRLIGPMVKKRRGAVLMISSGFGFMFMPGFAAYLGTKHYVTGFSEALRLELAPMGVVVTQVCPGPVATEFEENVGNLIGMGAPSVVEISAEQCAREALRGFERGRALVVPGFLMRLLLGLGRLTPRFIMRLLYGPASVWLRKREETTRQKTLKAKR